jgi:hypothetical protein
LPANEGAISSRAMEVGSQGVTEFSVAGIISGGKLARNVRGIMVKKKR